MGDIEGKLEGIAIGLIHSRSIGVIVVVGVLFEIYRKIPNSKF